MRLEMIGMQLDQTRQQQVAGEIFGMIRGAAFADLDDDVRQSINRIKASPFIPRKDSVRGFVYEVETGRLREVS